MTAHEVEGPAEASALREWRRLLGEVAAGLPALVDECGRAAARAEPDRTLALEQAGVDKLRADLRAVASRLSARITSFGGLLPASEHWGTDVVVRTLATRLYGQVELEQLRKVLEDREYALDPDEPLPTLLAAWNGIEDSALNAALVDAEEERVRQRAVAVAAGTAAVDELWI
ncbi:hypothetical protein [Tsukamurella ocularis]|uniref:hypothetical protein n=1 Tax=Tsukamurella ocularis TaxID=1970234 RepID=UPI002169D344|nr:hypothetical protein [Tsukamurella ocularis]MCS3853296.1 hypothetical protein [Tsukamurella ocularis]